MALFEKKENNLNVDNDDIRVIRTSIEYMADGKTLKHIASRKLSRDTGEIINKILAT